MRAIRYFYFCSLGGALLIASLNAAAQVVECVDANGKKTYAQSCPNESDKTRDIAAPKPPPKAADTSWKDKEADFERRRQERLKNEARPNSPGADSADAAQHCNDARSRLEALESGKQSKRVDPTTGEHVPMDSDKRQVELDQLHQEVQVYCH